MVKFAARINSFFHDNNVSLVSTINNISKVKEITCVDLNYPEHFSKISVKEIAVVLQNNNLKLNSVSPRFRSEFINGEFGNPDSAISQKAVTICLQAIDICRELGGKVVTIWLGYDGYDYSFQLNYVKTWDKVVQAFRKICEYGNDIQVSIEYKPFQPRVHSLISDLGSTMMLINEVGCNNLGITLDFCHSLMKGENPAFGLCMAAEKGKLYGIHLNDGNKSNDDGLMLGAVNFMQTLEFIYYLKKYKYDGVIYFDTFPVREDPILECEANIRMYKKMNDLIDGMGMDKIQNIIDQNDAIAARSILMDCFK